MGETENAADHLGAGETERILEQDAHEPGALRLHRRAVPARR